MTMAYSLSARGLLFCLTIVPVSAMALVCTLVGAALLCIMASNAARSDDPYHLGLDSKLVKGRLYSRMDDGFAIFLIGIGVNDWFKLPSALWVLMNLHALIRELKVQCCAAKPESGYLGGMRYIGNPAVIVQYWKSAEHIKRFASSSKMKHMTAWTALNKGYAEATASGRSFGVGVWHEIYQIGPGQYENIYHDMPLIGLGRCGTLGHLSADAKAPAVSGTSPGTATKSCPLGFS